MKNVFLALIASISIAISHAQINVPSADVVFSEAVVEAKTTDKKVFIIFHASWCGWCHKMDSSMNDPSCKKYFDDNFVIRHLVVSEAKGKEHLENPGGEEFKNKYHGKNQGIPYWLIFDKNGAILTDSRIRKAGESEAEGDNCGCPAQDNEVEFFITVLRKVTSLNDAALELITKRFLKNK